MVKPNVAVLTLMAMLAAGCTSPPVNGTPPTVTPTGMEGGIVQVAPEPWTSILFEDVADDAVEPTSEVAAENADRHADTTCTLFPEALPACSELPADEERPRPAGIPANPALDLRAVAWTEGRDNLTITFTVGSWDGDWDSLLPRPGSSVSYVLAWRSGENATCAHAVTVTFLKQGNGVSTYTGVQGTGPCRRVVFLPGAALAGAPARIQVDIPWAVIPNNGAGTPLARMRAWTASDETTGTGGILGYRGNLRPPAQYNFDLAAQLVDDTAVLEVFTIHQGPGDNATPLGQTGYSDADPAPAVERRDLEIEAVALDATAQHLTINVTMTELDAAPADHQVYMQFDGNPTPGGDVTIYVLQADVRNGQRNFTGYKLVAPDLHVEAFPFEGSVAPGAPGVLSFRVDRNDMEPLQAGDLLQRIAITASLGSVRGSQHLAAGQGVSYFATARTYDVAHGYLVVGQGPAHGADVDRIQLDDPRADARVPPLALTQRSDGQGDIVRVEVSVASPTMARVVLALGDLSQIEVPKPYDALFDGVAVQTPDGTFTIGYRLDVSGVPRFICGGDRTMFAATPADPLSGSVVDIAGRLLPGPSAGAVGVIVFDVPTSCFGALDSDAGFRLAMTKVRAGTFLIRVEANALGAAGIEELDSLETTEPLALTFRTAALPGPPSFWARPFGIENFYDIAGITFTAASSLAALALLVRRRTRFRRYLRRIEEARLDSDLEARETALAGLRALLQRDLLRNRLPSDHFAIVEARLNPLLCRTRITRLSERFPGVPDALLARLETFVADGSLSGTERSRFLHLARGKVPAAELARLDKAIAAWA